MRASIVMPIVGYLILLNQNLMAIAANFREFFPHDPWRLLLIYYGSFCLSFSAIMYLIRCPHQIQNYSSPVDYINSEFAILSSLSFRAKVLFEHVREGLKNITSRQKRILKLDTHQDELHSVSFFQHNPEHVPVIQVLTWDWGLADTSRVLCCHVCAVFYAAGFVLLLIPTAATFVEVVLYTILHLFAAPK